MSKSYETQGRIHSIGQTTAYGQNGFLKREFVIMLTGEGENPEYPNYVQCELIKDKCALMDGYQIGHEIKVQFNLGGRLWEGNGNGERCFVSLQAWKVEPAQQAQQYQQAPQQQYQQPQQQYQQAAPQQPPMQQATATSAHVTTITPMDDIDSDRIPF